MPCFDITVVTCSELPEPDLDEGPLLQALAEAGLEARVCVWDDESVDWSQGRLTLIRSTWDYYRRRPEFLKWADAVEKVSMLHNPASTVRWNSHKGYLLGLPLRGVPVVPTVVVERNMDVSLPQICKNEGFRKIVVKPAVSAGSYETHAMEADRLDEDTYRRLLADGAVLVQPYMESVDDYGERSLIFIDGQFTHCVRKHPRFAGEDEKITGPHEPSERELAVAEKAMEVAGDDLLYGRVDLVCNDEDQAIVAELEVLEPSLFFRFSKQALQRMVTGIGHRLENADDCGHSLG